jgi:hypothetical protein
MYLKGTSFLGGTLCQQMASKSNSNTGIIHQNLDAAPVKFVAFEPASRFGKQNSQIMVWLKEPWWVLVHPGYIHYAEWKDCTSSRARI